MIFSRIADFDSEGILMRIYAGVYVVGISGHFLTGFMIDDKYKKITMNRLQRPMLIFFQAFIGNIFTDCF